MNERVGEIAKTTKENAKKIAALAAVGGATLVAAGCGGEVSSEQEAGQEAVARYDKILNNSSPAGRFALQYLKTRIDTVLKSSALTEAEYWEFSIGDKCLGNTTYDIASAGARASALVDRQNPNNLLIKTGPEAVNLSFTGVESDVRLKPANEQTENVLETYGCPLHGKVEMKVRVIG